RTTTGSVWSRTYRNTPRRNSRTHCVKSAARSTIPAQASCPGRPGHMTESASRTGFSERTRWRLAAEPVEPHLLVQRGLADLEFFGELGACEAGIALHR